MKQEIIRVEPLSTYLERWKALAMVTRFMSPHSLPSTPKPVRSISRPIFSKDPPARIFINVPAWPGPFDIGE
jgi:hypothetical protein